MLNRRKQTNKKKCKKRQKDVWRGSSMKCEVRHATWTKGPPFLLQPTKSWEMGPNNLKASDDVDALKEIKRSVARLNHLQVGESGVKREAGQNGT